MHTLEAFKDALTTAVQYEDAAKWAVGDTVNVAIANRIHVQCGGIRQLEQIAAVAVGCGWRTIHRRRVVSATFAPDDRNLRVRWETHTRIAELCKGDTGQALAWLNVAADNEYTADQIETAIKATNGDAARGERVYVVKGAIAKMLWVEGRQVMLELDRDVEWPLADTLLAVTMAMDAEA